MSDNVVRITAFIYHSIFLVLLAPYCIAEDASGVIPASVVSQHQTLHEQPVPQEFMVQIKAISAAEADAFNVDTRITDLSEKLRKLPFSAFRLLSEASESVHLLSRQKFSFANGQSLCLRPVESNGHEVTMWLKWKGGDGMSILDTRVTFGMHEPMIVGIEGTSEGAGTVLAISVTPKS